MPGGTRRQHEFGGGLWIARSACYKNGANVAASTPGSAQVGVFTAVAPGENPVGPPGQGCGCPPNPGGPNAPAVTNTGPYTIQAYAGDGSPSQIRVPITCVETGVTLITVCGPNLIFHVATNTQLYHFTAPGGTYTLCADFDPLTYGAGSGSGYGGFQVSVVLSEG